MESWRAVFHAEFETARRGVTIHSADEFVSLGYSDDPVDYRRAAGEEAAVDVWRDVIDQYPDARVWVAQNKTVPLEILAVLGSDADAEVRHMVVMKRKLTPDLLDQLSMDDDESIRMRVAMHKNVAEATLQRLRGDPGSVFVKLLLGVSVIEVEYIIWVLQSRNPCRNSSGGLLEGVSKLRFM
jgi:hypothetical protein